MNQLLDTILKETYTQIQLRHRIRMLKSYILKALFGGATKQTLSQQDLTWLSSLTEAFFKNFSKDNVYQIFEELEGKLNQLSVLVIYLPFETTDNTTLQICSYARKTYQNPTLICDIKYDPQLIAGASLSWKGMYRDYSLRSRIEAKKEEVLAGFKKFLR